MFHFDRIQQKIFVIMGILILILSGILIFREYNYRGRLSADLSGTSPQIWENPGIVPSNKPAEEQPGKQVRSGETERQIIKVYITGKVKNPGVITMYEGDRVDDAIKLAGGALPDADLSRINLAMKVQDEDMYYVPGIGEEIPDEILLPGSQQSAGSKVNINKADQAQLETLPGIGPAKAQKIIEYREKHGGFKTIEEIMNVSGIGEKTYEALKDQIDIR
ncbi:MAG TPA: transporter [Clostridiales bacterium]|nr:transporter [Clostridiales bacterium]